jgi:hypothetical protein
MQLKLSHRYDYDDYYPSYDTTGCTVARGKVTGSPPHICNVNQITQHDTAEDDNTVFVF